MSDTLARWLALLAREIVVTWGFPPNPYCLDKIARFRDAGFTPWWFAAEYGVARARYLALYGQQATEASFDPQIQRLQQAQADGPPFTRTTLLRHSQQPATNPSQRFMILLQPTPTSQSLQQTAVHSVHAYEVRSRKNHRGVDLNFRCVAIRSALVR